MSAGELDRQVQKILASPPFAGKVQMQRLLEILYRHRAHQAVLRPDGIIRELWGEKAQARTASNLATEINRLRRLLAAYYENEGRGDPIRIELPIRSPGGSKPGESRWIATRKDEVAAEPVTEEVVPPVEADALPAAKPISEAGVKPTRTLRFPRLPAGRILFWTLASGVALVCVATAGLLYRQSHPPVPQAIRLEGNFLRVLDRSGNELWRQFFADGFWSEYYADESHARVLFADLEGEKRTSVLFLYHPAIEAKARTTTLICYSDRGEERWRWQPGRPLPYLNVDPPFYKSMDMEVLKPDHGTAPRIVVSSQHMVYFPHQIAVLDARGHLLSEYWHSGHLDWMRIGSLDGDGKQQIVAGGIANGYRQATLVVLDADRVDGASVEATRPELQIRDLPAARERTRILFPRSDMGVAIGPYNVVQSLSVEGEMTLVSIHELPLSAREQFFYRFDRSFRLVDAEIADGFRQDHDAYYHKAGSRHLLDSEEEARLRQTVCLAGCNASPGNRASLTQGGFVPLTQR